MSTDSSDGFCNDYGTDFGLLEELSLPDDFTERSESRSLATKIISVKFVGGKKVDIEDPIDLSGLSPSDFNPYLQAWPIDREGCFVVHRWPRLLLLWKLAHCFHNEPVRQFAKDELEGRLNQYSAISWYIMSENIPNRTWKRKMIRLQEAWRICRDNRLPLERPFVEAVGRAPPQVLAACVDNLAHHEDDIAEMFVVEVMKDFALRLVDSKKTAQKPMTPPGLPKIKEKKRKTRDRSQIIADKFFEAFGRLTATILVVAVFSHGVACLSQAP